MQTAPLTLLWIVAGAGLMIALTSTPAVVALPNFESKQTYCGHHITSTLAMFCKGRYLSMMDIVIKRAQGDDDDDDNDSGNDDTTTADADSYADEALALERHRLEHSFGTASLQQRLGGRQRRGDRPAPRPRRANEQMYVYRGIADECCMRPCSVRTLLSYCRTPPKY